MFYWSHISYVTFWALLCLHCQGFWLWFLLPGLLFALGKYQIWSVEFFELPFIEVFCSGKGYMALKWFSDAGRTHVVCGVLLPSRVTQLILRQKKGMHFQVGDSNTFLIIRISVNRAF